jgi:hypothetical protein
MCRKIEEICGCEEETLLVQCEGLSTPEGSPVEERVTVWIEREASSSLHWTFQNLAAN